MYKNDSLSGEDEEEHADRGRVGRYLCEYGLVK